MTAAMQRPPVGHYEVHLTCPHCGGLVEPVAEGKPTGGGSHVQAIVRCAARCMDRRYQLIALLRDTNDGPSL